MTELADERAFQSQFSIIIKFRIGLFLGSRARLG
jgi:hypothetical protein